MKKREVPTNEANIYLRWQFGEMLIVLSYASAMPAVKQSIVLLLDLKRVQ